MSLPCPSRSVHDIRWFFRVAFGLCLVLLPASGGRLAWGDAADPTAAVRRMADTDRYLSSDLLEGRGVGTHGLDLAADYIAIQFRQYGLKTDLWDGGPFQKLKVNIDAQLGPGNRLALVAPAGGRDAKPETAELVLGKDFTPLAIGASDEFDLPLVFVGYGITAPAAHYDDYAGVDVTGKAAIVLRHQPRESLEDAQSAGLKEVGQVLFRHKACNAYEHGAAAVIFINDKSETLKRPGHEDRLLPFLFAGTTHTHADLPVLTCRRAIVDRILAAASGSSLAKIEEEIDRDLAPRSRELPGWRISGRTVIREIPCEVKNVAAVLPGLGPDADETLVIGAHYDHLGLGARIPGTKLREIYHGADDNASGVAVLLEIARTLVQRPAKAHRRIIFITFTGEEMGFFGSSYYVNHPLVPLANTAAMLNLDMLGRLRDDKLTINSVGTGTGFSELLDRANASCGLRLTKVRGASGRSDQASFYAKHIPNIHFFTGRHPDYHSPTDTFEKLNLAGMERIAGYVTDVVVALAEARGRPDFVVVPMQHPHDPDLPFFGGIIDFTREEPGCPVASVVRGSPAERCGIRAGDVIVRFGRSRIGSVGDFVDAEGKYAAAERVRVTVRRGAAAKTFEAKLDPPQ
jgi:hypothetical protein